MRDRDFSSIEDSGVVNEPHEGSGAGRLVVTGPATNFGFVMLENMATGELTVPDGRKIEELSQEELVALVRSLNRVMWENGKRAHEREQAIHRELGEILRGLGNTDGSTPERKVDTNATDDAQIDKRS